MQNRDDEITRRLDQLEAENRELRDALQRAELQRYHPSGLAVEEIRDRKRITRRLSAVLAVVAGLAVVFVFGRSTPEENAAERSRDVVVHGPVQEVIVTDPGANPVAFGVTVGSFQDPKHGVEMLRTIRRLDLPIQFITHEQDGTPTRLMVGPFRTRREAEDAVNRIDAEVGVNREKMLIVLTPIQEHAAPARP